MKTTSLCPVCKDYIPATITIGEQVLMSKTCPKHGDFEAVVEVSPTWYDFCNAIGDKDVYDGFMIDITGACNITCAYCYHDNTGKHKPLDEVLATIEKYKAYSPIIITGGEPTLHPDIIEIVSAARATGDFVLLTNGVKLSEPKFFQSMLPVLDCDGVLMVGLSFHKESASQDIEFLRLCRDNHKIIGTAFYVIDDLSQIDDALALYEEYDDVIHSLRIKAASNLGSESNADNHIYTSQMVDNVLARGGIFDDRYSNKVSYASMLLHGKELRLCAWYDKYNIDLEDISGPPYCLGPDNNVYNLVTACILGEPCTM